MIMNIHDFVWNILDFFVWLTESVPNRCVSVSDAPFCRKSVSFAGLFTAIFRESEKYMQLLLYSENIGIF